MEPVQDGISYFLIVQCGMERCHYDSTNHDCIVGNILTYYSVTIADAPG